MKDVIIIGAGPAGLTAAVYALRAGLGVLIFDRLFYGGQTAVTSEIENYPSIQKITGPEFANNIYQQAISQGAEFVSEEVLAVKLNDTIKTVITTKEYHAKAVIIANGAKRRKLDCEGEEELTGKGVSYCATCDGAFFKDKDVAIVGGGNTAMEDAMFLSNLCRKVYLIHRSETFRADKVLIDSVKTRANVQMVLNSEISKINGSQQVSSIDVQSKEGLLQEISVSAVFIAIGLVPDNDIYRDLLQLDEAGYIIADETCRTNIPNVYVAGDCRTKQLRQIITAAADGAIAAWQAANDINVG